MKSLLRSLLVLSAFVCAATAFAAHSDYYLKIEGGKGDRRVVPCPNGECTLTDLAPGDYTLTACTQDGKPLDAESAATYEIKSPRDVATGQSSGKRQHKPISITKEWSTSSPVLKFTVPAQDTPVVLKTGISTSRSNLRNK